MATTKKGQSTPNVDTQLQATFTTGVLPGAKTPSRRNTKAAAKPSVNADVPAIDSTGASATDQAKVANVTASGTDRIRAKQVEICTDAVNAFFAAKDVLFGKYTLPGNNPKDPLFDFAAVKGVKVLDVFKDICTLTNQYNDAQARCTDLMGIYPDEYNKAVAAVAEERNKVANLKKQIKAAVDANDFEKVVQLTNELEALTK